MLTHKLITVLTAVVGVTFGGWLLAEGPPAEPASPPRPMTLPKSPNQILAFQALHLTLIDPDGKTPPRVREGLDRTLGSLNQRLSPDGTKVAAHVTVSSPEGGERKLAILSLIGNEPPQFLDLGWHDFAWSPDGSELASSSFVPDPGQKWHTTHALFNIKTGEKKPLPFPPNHVLQDWSRDGRYFLTTEFDLSEARPATMRLVPTRLVLLNRDGTEYTSILGASKDVCFGRLSPDGKQVLYTTQTRPTTDSPGAGKEELAVVDIATKVSTLVADVPLNGRRFRICWSPDGKRIAYSWMPKFEGKPEDAQGQEFESVLVTCDPDGKNVKTIATGKGPLQGITLDLVDWR